MYQIFAVFETLSVCLGAPTMYCMHACDFLLHLLNSVFSNTICLTY
jgi:hypothetical protein